MTFGLNVHHVYKCPKSNFAIVVYLSMMKIYEIIVLINIFEKSSGATKM